MSNNQSQDSISQDDMRLFLNFVLGAKQVENELEAKQLKRLYKRKANLGDVVTVFRAMTHMQDRLINQLIVSKQVQQRVLSKLGATDEMFKVAQLEYKKELEETTEELEKNSSKDREEVENSGEEK